METTRKLDMHYDPASVEAPNKPGHVFLYKDGLVPFLRLKVTPSKRTWQFDSCFAGKHFKRAIGDAFLIGLPEARLKAYEWARALEDGKLPPTLADRTKEAVSRSMKVGTLYQRYYDEWLVREARTVDEIDRGFRAYWKEIRDVPVANLDQDTVQQWVHKLEDERGKATAAKQFTNLKACLNYAKNRGWIKTNLDHLKSVKTCKSQPSEEYLKPEEFQQFTDSLAHETDNVRDALMMMLWTLQRKGNVLSMKWREIDWSSKVWIIPAGKAKSKRTYHIALSDKALEILQSRKDNCSEYVFPSNRRSHLKYVNKAWLEIRERAKLKSLKIHSLRHTGATWLALSGASSAVIQQAMQHGSITTSQRYIHIVASATRGHLNDVQERMTKTAAN